jgi:hypothetical protein
MKLWWPIHGSIVIISAMEEMLLSQNFVISFDLNLFSLCFVVCHKDPVQVPYDLHKYFISLNESFFF